MSLLALAVGACGSLKVTLSSQVPPRDERGQPLPVVMRLYQLSSKDRFEKADFLSLVKSDQKLLEQDILWRKETVLFPSAELVVKEDRKKGAKYFAVVALFREKGTTWRQVVDLGRLWPLSVKVKVYARTVTVD
ncbi:MAG: type VI secretion system lipoprotein TssJ [Nitrospira sp.]|nr:type VI secretion system lipoprotein TssJ [Nitrospira sp.]